MGVSIRAGTCFHLLVLTLLFSPPAEARLFDATLKLTERAEAAAAGDLDGDGIQDIVLFREVPYEDVYVGICFGRGDGTFRQPVDYSVGDLGSIARASLAIGDLDEDGDPDLAVMAYRLYSSRSDVWVVLNSGDGTFDVGEHYQVAYCAGMMKSAGDLDGDGHLDLAVVHSDCGAPGQQGWLSVLFGRGDGTFEKAILQELDFEASSLAAGDFNHDGAQDLVFDEFQNDVIVVLLGNGDGTFQSGGELLVGLYPTDVTAGDLNADGSLDLAVAHNNSRAVSVLIGMGDGNFQPAEHYQVAWDPLSVEISDIDNDSIPDLIATSFRGTNGDISVLRGQGDGTFQDALPVETGHRPEFGVIVADFDCDSRPDLLTYNGSGYGLSIALGNGDGTFAVAPSTNTYPGFYRAVAGDVNGDGNPDIVLPAVDSEQIPENMVVRLGRGDGTFGSKVGSGSGNKFDSVAVDDLNRDGFSDAVSWRENDPYITTFLGRYDGGMQEAAVIDVGHYPRYLATDDLDGDGKIDLIVGATSDSFLLSGHGDGTFEPPVALGLGSSRGPFDSGDLNHDGIPDLAVVHRYGDSVQVLLGRGDGTFAAPVDYSVPVPQSVVIGDLNEDGHPELVLSCNYSCPLRYLPGNGDGSFQDAVVLNSANVESPQAIEYIADLDLDGHLDLVVRCYRWAAVLPGNGDASFRAFVYGIENGAHLHSLSMADLESDGDLDLVVTGEYRDCKVSTLINNTTGRTISGDYAVSPLTGTLPFETNHQVYLRNLLHGHDALYTRRASVAVDVEIGSGAYFSNWRAGYTNLSPNEVHFRNWPAWLPADPTLAGTNTFHFHVMDTTPPPYNQPPYPPSGDSASRVRSVFATMP